MEHLFSTIFQKMNCSVFVVNALQGQGCKVGVTSHHAREQRAPLHYSSVAYLFELSKNKCF